MTGRRPRKQYWNEPTLGTWESSYLPEIVLGLVVLSGGLLLLAFLGPATPLWYVAAALAVCGLGFGASAECPLSQDAVEVKPGSKVNTSASA